MTDDKAIEIIKAECYRMNPLDLDGTTNINKALDRAVDALKERIAKVNSRDQELIIRFRKLQQDALKRGCTQNGGYSRGVSDCLRVLLGEYEVPEAPEVYETRGY